LASRRTQPHFGVSERQTQSRLRDDRVNYGGRDDQVSPITVVVVVNKDRSTIIDYERDPE